MQGKILQRLLLYQYQVINGILPRSYSKLSTAPGNKSTKDNSAHCCTYLTNPSQAIKFIRVT